MEITDDTFYMTVLHDTRTIHDTRSESLSILRENASSIDADDSDSVSVVRVSIEGEDWKISEVPWQQIALELLKAGDGQ